jgi:SAM-dependent methyltransferase
VGLIAISVPRSPRNSVGASYPKQHSNYFEYRSDMNTDPILLEINRIQTEYARRARIACHRPLQDYYYAQLTKSIAEALGPMSGRSVLDVGCGDGTWLMVFRELGASRLAGIELSDKRCADASRNVPEAKVTSGSAHRLPWPDAHFDVVSQFVVFTSVLDSILKKRIAKEMLRVVKPSGVILWYDFRVNNPRNRHVRGIGKAEIAALFPFCDIQLRSLILAPPLASLLVPHYPGLVSMLEKVPFLRTHYLGIIKPLTR